ncbi:response regulator transcription factor [Streptomyces sp. NPDC058430]|uniref:response regulator transcription factor n=1 Tax=Streptomyces sp. NPDC058430 TaxID=3346495 RepID=UPI003664902F
MALATWPAPHAGGLTARERHVLTLIAEGLSNRRITERRHISPGTAGRHASHIPAKLGAGTRTESATIAHRRGLTWAEEARTGRCGMQQLDLDISESAYGRHTSGVRGENPVGALSRAPALRTRPRVPSC